MRNPFPVEVSKVFQNTQKTTLMRKCVICFVISYDIGATAKYSTKKYIVEIFKFSQIRLYE